MREFFSLLGTALLAVTGCMAFFLFGVGVGATEPSTDQAVVTAVMFPCPARDACDVDYRHGAWWIDDERMPVDCPTEDSCAAEFGIGGWHVYQTPEVTTGDVVTGPRADAMANASDSSGRTHAGCAVTIGDTTVGTCSDGYRFES